MRPEEDVTRTYRKPSARSRTTHLCSVPLWLILSLNHIQRYPGPHGALSDPIPGFPEVTYHIGDVSCAERGSHVRRQLRSSALSFPQSATSFNLLPNPARSVVHQGLQCAFRTFQRKQTGLRVVPLSLCRGKFRVDLRLYCWMRFHDDRLSCSLGVV